MAGNDKVIDELQIKVQGTANDAINSLSKLQTQLRHTARSLGAVSAGAKSLDRLGIAFRQFDSININNLTKAINQLERLSNIDFKNLDGKKLNLEVRVNGASEAERKIYAIEDAVKHMDVTAFSRKFSQMFDLKGDARKQVTEQFKTLFHSIAYPDDDYKFSFGGLKETIMNNGAIARSAFDATVQGMKDEYQEFIDYVREKPFHVSPDAYRSEWKDKTFDNGMGRFFEKAKNQGRELEADWTELASKFPTIFSADDAAINNEEDQIDTLIAKIKEAQDVTTKKGISLFDQKDMKGISDHFDMTFMDTYEQMKTKFNTMVNDNMKESAYKIPLDVNVDAERIQVQIQKAIESATKTPFKLPVKFAIAPEDIKNPITKSLGEVDTDAVGNLVSHLKEASTSMATIGSINAKETGLTSFVNSVRKLSETDTSKFNAEPLKGIVDIAREISGIDKIQTGVTRLVTALAKLATAGDNTRTTAKFLPALGEAVKTAAGHLASVGGLPDQMNAFVSSLASLANAGNKTNVTAENLGALGESLKTFLENIQGAPQASESLIRMTEALGVLASSGGKAGAAAKSIGKSMNNMGDGSQKAHNRLQAISGMVQNLGDIFAKAAGYVKQGAMKIIDSLRKIKSSSNGLERATSSIKNMIGAMIGFRGITGFGNLIKETIQLGAAMTEIDHIVESVFGDMAGYVDGWAKNAITEFGIAEQSAKQYAGVLSSMFQASQIGYMDAGKMSMDLVGLAGDLSAFYNIDTETAFNKIRSGMAGMVRPLRDLGIDLTAATLNEFALSQGITKSYTAMSQAEKVMLRYRYLMENTKTQQHDFQKTSLSLANSMRTLKAYASAVGTQIGVGLGSALRHVIILMNTLAKYALKAATAFANFMQTIFGKYKGGASGIAMEGLGDSLDYADDLSGAADGIADGLGNASNAAKELKKNLSVLPFDELNQLNKDMEETASGSGTGGAGGAGDLGGVTDGLLDWGDLLENSEAGKLPEAISAWAQQIKAAFEGQNWNLLGQIVARGMNEGLQKVYDLLDPNKVHEKVDPWINAFTTSFNSWVKHFDWNLLGSTIGRGINDVVSIMNDTIEGIEWVQLGSQIASGFNGLMNEVDFEEVGNLIGNKIMALWDTLNGFVHEFEWDKLGSSIADIVNGLNDKLNLSTIADTLSTGINGIFTALGEFAKKTKWDEIATNIANGITTFIENTNWEENAQSLTDFITSLCDALVKAVDEVGDEKWEELGNGIATTIAGLPWKKILKTVGHVMVTALGGILKGMLSDPAGVVALAVILGLGFLKFSHSSFGLFAGNLVEAITGEKPKSLIIGGIKKLFKTATKEAAEDATVQTTGKAAGTSLGKSIATGLSEFASSGVGMAMIETGAIGIALVAAKKFSEAWDEARGGNGLLTDFGTGIQDFIDNMRMMQQISEDQQEELFKLKESYEDMGATATEAVQGIIDKLVEYGVPMADAIEMANQMISTGQGQADIYQLIADYATLAAESQGELNSAFGETTNSIPQVKQDLRNAIVDLMDLANQAGDTSVSYQDVLNMFDQTQGSVTTAEGAYNMLRQILEDCGGDASELNRILSEEYGYSIGEMGGHTETAKQYYDDLGTAAEGAEKRANQASRNTGQEVQNLATNVSESSGAINTAIGLIGDGVKTFQSNWATKLSDAAQNIFDFASNTSTSMSDSSQSVADYESNAKTSMKNNEDDFNNLSSNTIAAMIKIVTKVGVLATAITGMGTLIKSETSNMENSFSAAFGNITTSMTTLKTGINDGLTSIQTTVTNVMNGVKSAATMDLTGAGQSAAQSFASGFQSVHIPVPSISVVGYNYIDFGDGGWASYPIFGLNWYRAGGLFKGGNGSLIGIAEDGRDEAVLPLEDRRAMSRIGSAIAEAGGSGGMSTDMADRIAEKIADVLINTRTDDQSQVNYIELKVGEEVLAQAVARGQQKLDYRNNPTAKFA